MNEINIITHKGKAIAHHYYTKDEGWVIVCNKELKKEEKEVYKKEIQEMADRNKIKVDFEDEK